MAQTIAAYANNGTAWTKVIPTARVELRPQDATHTLSLASGVMHLSPDTTEETTDDATNQATAYALANALKATLNTHMASTVFHQIAGGQVTAADADTDGKCLTLTQNLLSVYQAHLAATTVHGGKAGTALANTPPSIYSETLAILNAIKADFNSHNGTTAGTQWFKVPAAASIKLGTDVVWAQLSANGVFSVLTR